MDMLNRFMMRSSGERRHQPKSEAEAVAFAVLDWMKENRIFNIAFPGSEEGINLKMEGLRDCIERAQVR